VSAHTKGCRYEGGHWTERGEGCAAPDEHFRPLIEARFYNGSATCAWKGGRAAGVEGDPCGNPARWMPVLVFVAKGWRESSSTRVPAGILSLGICDVHRDAAAEDLRANVAPHVRDEVLNRSLRAAQRAEVRFDRIEWVQIARTV